MFSLFSFASGAIENAIITFNGLIQQFLGQLLATVAKWLGYFLKFQGNYFDNITIVEESWKLFRDFSNMFFILILVIIAFATIFDLKNYNWQGLMFKFIMAALLINFSLAIGGFLIEVSTTLSNVALNQFTDITENLAAGFGINNFITGVVSGSSADPSANLALSSYISSTGMIIMTVIILCAFVTAFAFSVARIPVLWALLIVSPVAWICSILPQTRKVWSMWWSWFLCWTFWMPGYLFALALGMIILNNRPDIAAATRLSEASGALAGAGNFIGFGVQEIFFFILTIIIMVFSLAGAIKMACSGAGVVVKGVSGGVNNFAKRATYFSSLQKGATAKLGEIQKKGLPGGWIKLYGGERGERLREARVVEGVYGERGAVQAEKDRVMREEIKTYKERFKATTNVEELRNNIATGTREQKLAIAELLKERGELRPDEMKTVFDLYREAGSDSNAIEFAKGIDYEKLSKNERQFLYENLGSQNAEIARKITIAQAEKGDWKKDEPSEVIKKLKERIKLFTQSGEKIEFLNKVKKFNMEEAIKASVDLELIKDKTYTQALEDEIKKLNIDKVADLSADTLGKLFANPDARRLIGDKINPDTVGNLAGKLSGEQLDVAVEKASDGTTTKTFKDLIAEKKKEFDAKTDAAASKAAELQAEALAKALQKAQQQPPPTTPPKPRTPPGFVPPGSTVSGGEVKNPNNVLDLRKKNGE